MKRSQKCLICGQRADRCHIKSKGAGGGVDEENIMHLCRTHHVLQHTVGWGRLMQRFPVVEAELLKKGWVLEERFGVWKVLKR